MASFDHITAMECISAAGHMLPSFLIFEKSFPMASVAEDLPRGWQYGYSPNGKWKKVLNSNVMQHTCATKRTHCIDLLVPYLHFWGDVFTQEYEMAVSWRVCDVKRQCSSLPNSIMTSHWNCPVGNALLCLRIYFSLNLVSWYVDSMLSLRQSSRNICFQLRWLTDETYISWIKLPCHRDTFSADPLLNPKRCLLWLCSPL